MRMEMSGRRREQAEDEKHWQAGPKKKAAVNESAEPRDARPVVDRAPQKSARCEQWPAFRDLFHAELQTADENRPGHKQRGERDHGDDGRDARVVLETAPFRESERTTS